MDESARVARSRFSRRKLLQGGAAAVGTLASAGIFDVASAFATSGADPRPIPGGLDSNFNPVPSDPFIHILPPGIGFDTATITDFNGVVAAADVQGTANDGAYFFDADMRFMDGVYVGTDGRTRRGSFGFV